MITLLEDVDETNTARRRDSFIRGFLIGLLAAVIVVEFAWVFMHTGG